MALLRIALIVAAFRPTALEPVAAWTAIPSGPRAALATLGATLLQPAAIRASLARVLARLARIPAASRAAGAILRTLVRRALMARWTLMVRWIASEG